jgi:hypothetical protein
MRHGRRPSVDGDTRRQSKMGETISMERFEELLGKRPPLAEAKVEPRWKKKHNGDVLVPETQA